MDKVENQRVLIRVSEAAQMLSLGQTKAYELVRSGELPSVRIGTAIRIPVDRLNEFLSTLSASPVGSDTAA